MSIPPAERQRMAQRLDRVLALAERPGSAGERQAAEAAVGRLMCAAPDFWRSCLTGPASTPASEPPVSRAPHWRVLAQRCIDKSGSMTAWERTFVPNLLRQPAISPKQRTILRGIAARIGVLATP